MFGFLPHRQGTLKRGYSPVDIFGFFTANFFHIGMAKQMLRYSTIYLETHLA